MIVLGIDPGYAIVGWGVVRYEGNHFTPVRHGVITTPSKSPFSQRIECVYDDVLGLLTDYKPDAIAVEQLFFTSNQKTVIDVAQARGAIVLAARKAQVPFFEYTPLQVKQSVVGYGRAVKQQVMEMTRMLLGLTSIPKPDDAADALAIAICHAHSAGSMLGALTYGRGS